MGRLCRLASRWWWLGVLSVGASGADLPGVFNHPAGFSLRLPAGWQVQPNEDSHVIQIPNAGSESYYLFVTQTQGLTRADDPALVAELDQTVRGLADYLRLVGGARPLAAGGLPAAILVWEGRNPQGVEARFASYLVVLNDHLINLSGVGAQTDLVAREPVILQVMASISGGGQTPAAPPAGGNPLATGGNPLARPATPAVADPLVGRWQGEGLELDLTGANGEYTGSLTVNGQRMPTAVQGQGRTMHGQFELGGARYLYAIELAGESLTLTSGGTTYRLQRVGGLAPAPPAPGGNPLAQPAAAKADFSGTFALQTERGTNTLTLQQNGATVTGVLRFTTGLEGRIEGTLAGDRVTGLLHTAEGHMAVELALNQGNLDLTYMEVDPQTNQPRRESASTITFLSQGGGPTTAPTAPTAPPTQPQQPLPATAGGPGAGLQPGQVYQSGQRVTAAGAGISVTVPEGFRAQMPESGGFLIMADSQGRLAFVLAAALAGLQPSVQQLANDFLPLLVSPAALGEGVTLQLARQPEVIGGRLVVTVSGATQNAQLVGHLIGLVNDRGPNEAFVAVFGLAGDATVQTVAETLAGSVAFTPPADDPTPWFQQLAGRQLINDGGSHARTSPNTTLARDSRVTIALGPDGQFTYHRRSLGTVTTPGGLGAAYDTSDNANGTWRLFTSLSGPTLLLLPVQQDKAPMSYSLGVDNGQLTLDGAVYAVQ